MAHRYMNKVVKQKVRVPIISRHLDRWLTLAHIGARWKNWTYALVFGVFLMVHVIQDGLDGVRPWRSGSGGTMARWESDSTHLSLARFLWFASFKIGSTVRVLGQSGIGGETTARWNWALRTCLWRVSYGSRHSIWTRRCASF